MFNHYKQSISKPFELSETAVDGLFGGMLAGLIMETYLTLVGLIAGERLLEAMTQISPLDGLSPFNSILLHFAVSGVYGILFGMVYPWLFRRCN